MAVLSGLAGAVDGVATCRTWTVTHTGDLQATNSSGMNAGTVVLDGNVDWNGNYTAYGHTPAHMPGEAITFVGSIDGSNGCAGTGIVESVEIINDIEGGAPIGHTVNFARNGALTIGAAVATDVAIPDPPTSIGTKVEVGTAVGAPVYSDIEDARGWTLTFTASNPAYVSSDTAGGNLRLTGNISGTIVVPVYEDDFADLPLVNTHSYIRLYVTDSTYWDIGFVKWAEVSDMSTDIESPGVIAAVLNGQWTAYEIVDAAQARGYIKLPDASVWWGT